MPSPRALRAGKAVIELGMPSDKVEKALRRLEKRARTIGENFKMVGRIGLAAGGAIAAAFVKPIASASRLEETMNKFNVVFGASSDMVKKWSDGFADEIGRSKQQIADFMASTQDLFVPLGFEPGAATEMSKQITKLSLDLASFNNLADGAVLRDLHAALTGSGEVMKKYGVIVSEAAVKQELLNQGMDPTLADDQQKVMARLNIILRGTTAAQGDAERSAGSFANKMKELQGKLEDVSAEIGQAILPMVTDLVDQAGQLTKVLGIWLSQNKELIKTIAQVGTALGVAGAAAYAVGTAFNVAAVAVKAFTVVLTIATAHPVILAITAIALAVGAIALAFHDASDAAADFASTVQEEMQKAVKAAAHLDIFDTPPTAAGGARVGPITPAEAARQKAQREALAADLEVGFGQGQENTDRIMQGWLGKAAYDAVIKAGSAVSKGVESAAHKGAGLIGLGEEALANIQQAMESQGNLPESTKGAASIFDTRFAAQQFGGGDDIQQRQLKELEKIRQLNEREPGIGVV